MRPRRGLGDAERSRGLDQRAPGEQARQDPRLGRRQAEGGRDGAGTLLARGCADEYGSHGRGLQPRAQLAAGRRQDVGDGGLVALLGEADGESGLAEARLVLCGEPDRLAQLPGGRRRLRRQHAARTSDGTAVAQHLLRRPVGVQDGRIRVGEHHPAAQGVERLGHACALDGADVQHVVDRERTANVRQQQAAELDLPVGDDARLRVAAEREPREARRGVHREVLHDVDDAERLQDLPIVAGRLHLGRRHVA
jgi:hypothetical protein